MGLEKEICFRIVGIWCSKYDFVVVCVLELVIQTYHEDCLDMLGSCLVHVVEERPVKCKL